MDLKIKWISISACLIAAIILCAIIISGFISRQNVEDEYRAKVQELLRETINIFEEIRGFSLDDIEVEVVTISWAKENWGRAYAEADKENILREERIYKALFMIPENASLYEAEIEWSGMIAAAVWQNKIYVVKEYFNPSDKFNAERTLIHELTHLMQNRFSIPEIPTFDGEKAKSALIEGDACLMEEVYLNRTKEISFITKIAEGKSSMEYYGNFLLSIVSAALPDSISRLYYFPYEYGLKFVKALYAKGGWEAVNQAYQNPPTTTEQIMHPEKYLVNETSNEVKAPLIAERGWQKIKSERFGEHFILVMLENWIPAVEAVRAAEGWGGDNFTYYEQGNDYLFTWNITWDSVEDASEFVTLFRGMMAKTGAKEVEVGFWQAYGRSLSIIWRGASAIIVSSTNETAIKNFLMGWDYSFAFTSNHIIKTISFT
ncbi:MAG: hypothetical protein QXZ25_05445 [Candidatus Bathyarchaeia archaeon]